MLYLFTFLGDTSRLCVRLPIGPRDINMAGYQVGPNRYIDVYTTYLQYSFPEEWLMVSALR